ncbi:hypothetical protein [Clostridium algidicarnis]|uniref:hypothetical protein n=1 Tax=Clostridium algidicarnis TaxID=37659 RepID=UPI001625BB47|nr:hypothetical protein [Clostridium algidicarnis]MBB6696666.1 hypothetical protein [Clostridium algidicarnis]
MDIKTFEFLAKEVPTSISEIREALDLLSSSIDSSIDQIGEKVSICFKNRDFKKASELSINSEELNNKNKSIQDLILNLDKVIDNCEIEEVESQLQSEATERNIPNYNDYLVDTQIEYTLYEDFTHKRPCAFKIGEEKIEVRDWKDTLVKTIEYLAKKDMKLLKSFPDSPKMNGKKVIYFSRVELPNMRAPRKIKSGELYIETNLSANSIRNIIIKALSKYNIKLNNYKVYLKADYSELHK